LNRYKTVCLTVLSWLQYVGVSRASGVRAPWNMAPFRNGGPSEWRTPTVYWRPCVTSLV